MEILTRIMDFPDRPVAPHSEQAAVHAVAQNSPTLDDENVHDTPENRNRIERALRALDIFNPNHPNTRFRYAVHDSGRIQVELYNYLTGEVVQSIPSKKVLEYADRMQELTGFVFEEHA